MPFNTQSLLLFASVSLALLLNSSAYDIGCIYPDGGYDDVTSLRSDFAGKINDVITDSTVHEGITQPFMARFGLYISGCTALCIAYHDPLVKNPFTKYPTFFTVPSFGQNAYSISMCQVQCWPYVWEDFDDMMPQMKEYFNILGFHVTDPSDRPDIENAMNELSLGNSTALQAILLNDDFHPYTIGHIAGFEVKNLRSSDGFNEDGKRTWSPSLQEDVPCSGNCRRFQDTVGYNPKPDPRVHSFLPQDPDKYSCTGLCRRWQPEQKRTASPSGRNTHEDFAFPHIGYRANTYLRSPALTVDDPNYNYYEESLLVVEHLRNTTSNVEKKIMIEMFRGDSGSGMHSLRGSLSLAIYDQLFRKITFQDDMLSMFGVSLVEYDGLIQVWKEKVRHDLVRPSTVIKHWDDDVLNTYGGDASLGGPVNIYARDFESFLPLIEPSAEFPSVNSCYCQGLMEFNDLYYDEMYNEKLENFDIFYDGPVPGNMTFSNMEEYRNMCSLSQLWGGFHFTASVTAGEELCTSLGVLAVEYLNEIKNGSNFNGGWRHGDILPSCPN